MRKYTLVIFGAIVFMASTLAYPASTLAYPVVAGDPEPSVQILQVKRLAANHGVQTGPPPDAPPRQPPCPPNVKC